MRKLWYIHVYIHIIKFIKKRYENRLFTSPIFIDYNTPCVYIIMLCLPPGGTHFLLKNTFCGTKLQQQHNTPNKKYYKKRIKNCMFFMYLFNKYTCILYIWSAITIYVWICLLICCYQSNKLSFLFFLLFFEKKQ